MEYKINYNRLRCERFLERGFCCMSISEELFDAWVNLSLILRNERFMGSMTFNESIICRLIIKETSKSDVDYVAFKELCRKSFMVKSAVTRVLNDLERKGIVEKIKLDNDKKSLYLKMKSSALPLFNKEHEKLLEISDFITDSIGTEDTEKAIYSLNKIREATQKLLQGKE